MAYSQEGVLGNFKGRLGNLVVYQMNGKTVMRRMPVRQGGVVSPHLKKAQGDFSKVMAVMQAVKPFVRRGFDDAAEGRFVFQRALSENLKRFREAGSPEHLDWLVLSLGERAGAKDLSVAVTGNEATISWGEAEEGKPSAQGDNVLLMALNAQTLEETIRQAAAIRGKGQASLKLPKSQAGQQLLLFIAFYDLAGAIVRKDLKNISTSQMLKV
ncbi:MAG: DUF6266 family protein [Bacteroidales bacterium]|jgi:hypothetical protein|nr:DUF6266 family protein [Bacteroidales bacterium]NLM91439.1 hypothetical protein [Bacteroidales bacterium]